MLQFLTRMVQNIFFFHYRHFSFKFKMDSFYSLSMDFFNPLPPNLVHIVIECPLTWGKYFGPSRGESTKTSPLPSPLIEIVAQKAGYE